MKYNVSVWIQGYATIDVEADSPEEAGDMAVEKIRRENYTVPFNLLEENDARVSIVTDSDGNDFFDV